MVHYTIYTVTNQVNRKVYHGKHMTSDLNDDYMGTGGAHYQNAIKKYGRESFKKTIDYLCIDYDTMTALEKHLSITENWTADPMCYNENIGGDGGWHAINERRKTDPEFAKRCYEAQSTAVSEAHKNKPKSLAQKKKLSQSNIGKHKHLQGAGNPMFGQTHTPETRKLISNARMGKSHCRWITNGIENDYILKNLPTPDGWRNGRTIRKSADGTFVKAA